MQNNIIVQYNGSLTQAIISSNMSIIEEKIKNMSFMGKIATIVVELSQNMMTYSKTPDLNSNEILPAGFIEVIQSDESMYIINSKNIVNIKDKEKLELKLQEIQSLNASEIKKRYKELRHSGKDMHDNNGGIGFYEIAKLSPNLEYKFIPINEQKFYFLFKIIVEPK